MSDDAAVLDAIFAHHGVRRPWAPMAATGIANRIYATDDVVLRVAVGSEESISDARTESIAAPAARAADEPESRMLWNRADMALGCLEIDPRQTETLRELLPFILPPTC